MKQNLIDIDFINNWELKYDSHESDENEYNAILALIEFEINNSRTITKNTFIRILSWKSPRLKGIVKLSDYESDYKPEIERTISETNIKIKLEILLTLYGIQTPTATTILHFIYPDVFPIIDFRTLEALYHRDLIKSKSKSQKNYWIFYEVIHRIKLETKYSLRKIDRALFSYHKMRLGKVDRFDNTVENNIEAPVNGTIIQKIDNKMRLEHYIDAHYKMTLDIFAKYLADKYIIDGFQKEVFLKKGVWLKVRLNYIAGLLLSSRGKGIFTPKEIREIICNELIPLISRINDASLSGQILTQDVHDKAKREYNNGYPCLKKEGNGIYSFIGFSC